MSGQQWGTAIGAVVGAFFGMPQLGAAIGGMVGGWIAPTEVKGPHIGDGQTQSSAEGMPISWILGTAGWVQGNIVQKSARREVKKEDDGKGSGTVAVTYEAHQDFCILICESSEHRNSLMAGVLICKVDGKIVYDMRPESNFGAENAKFLRNHTFYNGNEAQLPDPTMEAITGIGNTPYYRGVFTMVGRDVNLSAHGDRIPTYEFVMVGAGDAVADSVEVLVAPSLSSFQDADYPLVNRESEYTLVGRRDGVPDFTADTIAEIQEHFANYYGVYRKPDNYLGYSDATGSTLSGFTYSGVEPQASVLGNQSVILVYSDLIPQHYANTSVSGGAMCPIIGDPGAYQVSELWSDNQGEVMFSESDGLPTSPSGYSQYSICTGQTPVNGYFPQIIGSRPLLIQATRKKFVPVPVAGDPCTSGYPTLIPDAAGYVQDCDGNVFAAPTYAPATGADLLILQQEATSGGFYTKQLLGPVLRPGDDDDTEAFWEAAYDAAVADGTMVPGLVYLTDYPVLVAAGDVYTATTVTDSLATSSITYASAITRICERSGLTADQIDVVEMTDALLGYPIMQPYTGAEVLRPLMMANTCYGTEHDGKIYFYKHGEDIEVVIDPDDFIEGTDETHKDTREQAVEYPRLISVTAIDPTQDYTARPQTERRISPDVNAKGEQTMQVPVVLPPDEHRQLASIGMKVSYARQQGRIEFSVPYSGNDTYLKLVPGKPFALDAKRYVVDKMRLEDGEIHVEAVYDRQSAYTSNVTATPALPPTAPPSSIGGVTLFAAMNLPRLRSQDSSSGMYIAVDGLLDSWPGCLLQMSIDDEASWTTAIPSMTQSSVMGYLTAAVGDAATDTLSVAVHGGSLDSITDARLADGGNPCAVITSGVSELLQFKTSDETDEDSYDLTDLVRGGLGTAAAAHSQGERFAHLGNVYFLPLDLSLAGRVIHFRPVTFGTAPENNASYAVTFNPLFSGPQISAPLTVGGVNVTVSGTPIYVVTHA